MLIVVFPDIGFPSVYSVTNADKPFRNTMRAILEAERHSFAANSFSLARSSSDKRMGTGFLDAMPFGNRDRCV